MNKNFKLYIDESKPPILRRLEKKSHHSEIFYDSNKSSNNNPSQLNKPTNNNNNNNKVSKSYNELIKDNNESDPQLQDSMKIFRKINLMMIHLII